MPSLHIITGSNGAGKSTIGAEFLPNEIKLNYPIFDGDLLFVQKQKELFPYFTRSPKEAQSLAWKFVTDTFEKLTNKALYEKKTFAYEGHFINDATWDIPKRFKNEGYKIHLLFLGLANMDLSQLRVTDRVNVGGHYVNRKTIEANFEGNLNKLDKYFKLIDYLTIIDTSEVSPILLAKLQSGVITYAISKHLLPQWFTKYLVNITSQIS